MCIKAEFQDQALLLVVTSACPPHVPDELTLQLTAALMVSHMHSAQLVPAVIMQPGPG